MMQSPVGRRDLDGVAQNLLAVVFSSRLPVKIRKIDGGACKLRAEAERCLVFRVCFAGAPATGVEGPQRGSGFRPIRIELLRGNEFLGRAIELSAVYLG